MSAVPLAPEPPYRTLLRLPGVRWQALIALLAWLTAAVALAATDETLVVVDASVSTRWLGGISPRGQSEVPRP